MLFLIVKLRLLSGCRFLLFAAESAETWCKEVGKRIDCVGDAPSPPEELSQNRLRLGAREPDCYSMLFRDSVMLMFSSRRDMAMLTMKAKTKVRTTASA